MSTELVIRELNGFLERGDPEVLCIRGKWGVGKTYAWQRQLRLCQENKEIPLERYSYVSLFGVNSLKELKGAIFENVVILGDGKTKSDLLTLDRFVSGKIGPWRKFPKIITSIPFAKKIFGDDSAHLLSFLTIRDQIVCLDDLERKGDGLSVGDILGLASMLREQRQCKIVFLLNDEKLEGETKQKFESYLEKVVDISLVYEPTSLESVRIASEATNPISARAAELCGLLGVSNIRVINKIHRSIEAVRCLTSNFDEGVFEKASASVALFCWSIHQPEEAPGLEFLEMKNVVGLFGNDKQLQFSEKEVFWNALLESYGYISTDEFDCELIEGVRKGYFDPVKLREHSKVLHEKIVATKADGSFEEAWRAYHDSFADNQEEVLDNIFDSFMKNFKYISPLNLNGTVRLLKDLGRRDQACKILRHYVDNRCEEPLFFDVERFAFSEQITETEVRDAFASKYQSFQKSMDISDMLLRIKDGWDEHTLFALSASRIDDYKKAFKEASGSKLRKMIAGSLKFDSMGDATQEMKEISRCAREALKLIGEESPINARRVARYGIRVASQSAGKS